MKRRYPPLVLAVLVSSIASCSSGTSDADYRADVVAHMESFLLDHARAMSTAAGQLRDAIPASVGRGWDPATDLEDINRMKNAWNDLRDAWEESEGVLAAMYPDLDDALDQRYESFLAALGPSGDTDLFDATGVVGMHAVERILFAPSTPPAVMAREAMLPGYQQAAWPATESQANEFRAGVCAKLYDDIQTLFERVSSGTVDIEGAFEGMTALMGEQKEKVSLAGSRQDESRYAQRTMVDLKRNLAGTRASYAFFVPWLSFRKPGSGFDSDVQTAFGRLDQTYKGINSEGIPDPPDGWNSDIPTPADQASPFGKLFVEVVQEVDATYPGSAVSRMNEVARVLGLPEFVETE